MLVLYIHTGARKPMGRGILDPVTGGEDPSMLPPRRKEDREEERRRRAGLKWRMEWGRGRHGVLVISYILSYFGRRYQSGRFRSLREEILERRHRRGTTIFDLSHRILLSSASLPPPLRC